MLQISLESVVRASRRDFVVMVAPVAALGQIIRVLEKPGEAWSAVRNLGKVWKDDCRVSSVH